MGMTTLATSIVLGMVGKIMTCEFPSLKVIVAWSAFREASASSMKVPLKPI